VALTLPRLIGTFLIVVGGGRGGGGAAAAAVVVVVVKVVVVVVVVVVVMVVVVIKKVTISDVLPSETTHRFSRAAFYEAYNAQAYIFYFPAISADPHCINVSYFNTVEQCTPELLII